MWTHIAVVWVDGGQRRYYINGDLGYSGSAGTGPTAFHYLVFIGADPGASGDLFEFSGNIAEVRFWTLPRSQNEIRRIMHVALNEPRPALVANWHLSDDYDDSIGAFNGTPQGRFHPDRP